MTTNTTKAQRGRPKGNGSMPRLSVTLPQALIDHAKAQPSGASEYLRGLIDKDQDNRRTREATADQGKAQTP